MGILAEIAGTLTDPIAIFAGISLGLPLAIRSMRPAMAALVAFSLAIWIVMVTDVQIDTQHSAYVWQHMASYRVEHWISVNDRPAKVHLDGLRLAAAGIWAMAIHLGFRATRRGLKWL